MKKFIQLFLLVFLLWNNLCLADVDQGFVVQDIKIVGLKRIQLGTVLDYLPVHAGQTLKLRDTPNIIRALYKTGFFSHIDLERRNNTLIIDVQERPTIGSVLVVGNNSIPNKAMAANLKSIGVAEGQIYDKSTLDNVRESLQNQYYDRGNYNATVTTQVTPQSKNRVGITLNIHEGSTAKIKQIKIIGNHAYSQARLLLLFKLSKSHFWTFVTKQDQYSREKLDAGLSALKAFYLDKGYINFKVDSAQVSITPDKRDVYIVIHIDEGSQYKLKGYKLSGELTVPPEELEKLIELHSGDVFSRKEITATSMRIGNHLGNYGYAFAQVKPVPEVDQENKEVFVTFMIEPGNKIYVRRINFIGNTKTEDRVLRREVRQQEGAISSLANIKLSEQRLRMLSFFKNVTNNTKPVPGTDDQVDLDFHVVEAASATFTMGAGYSDTEGLLLNAGFNQPNFLGTGNSVGVHFNSSYYTSNYSLSYYNPYYTKYGIGRGLTAYANTSNYDKHGIDVSTYTMDQYGGNVYYSLPVSEHNHVNLGYGFQWTDLHISNSASLELLRFRAQNGERFRNLLFNIGWNYANFDRGIFPTQGFGQYFDGFIATPMSGKSEAYYKFNYAAHLFQPLFYDFILSLRGELGYGDGFAKTNHLPFYENYYAGGIGVQGSVRGYQGYSLGQRDSQGNNLGGNFLVDGTVALIVPTPFAKDTVRFNLFVDAGNVFNDVAPLVDPLQPLACSQSAGPIRVTTGVAAEWRSPMGPLVISLATPLNKQCGDRLDRIQFTVGTSI